jgi:hypothetical protein
MHEIGAFGGHPSSHVPKVQTEARRRSVFLEHRAIARTSSVHRAASSEKPLPSSGTTVSGPPRKKIIFPLQLDV